MESGEIERLRKVYLLKEVERRNKVGARQESAAEHTYSSLMLAQFFLPKMEQKIDELKVMQLLLFHDLVETVVGDTFILDSSRSTQDTREHQGAQKLEKELPSPLAEQFRDLWAEDKANTTIEARFARAIDYLDPMMQGLYDKDEWIENHFTEEKLRHHKEKAFVDFPVLQEFFEDLIRELRKQKAID